MAYSDINFAYLQNVRFWNVTNLLNKNSTVICLQPSIKKEFYLTNAGSCVHNAWWLGFIWYQGIGKSVILLNANEQSYATKCTKK